VCRDMQRALSLKAPGICHVCRDMQRALSLEAPGICHVCRDMRRALTKSGKQTGVSARSFQMLAPLSMEKFNPSNDHIWHEPHSLHTMDARITINHCARVNVCVCVFFCLLQRPLLFSPNPSLHLDEGATNCSCTNGH